MIHLKPGVRINILSPQAVFGMMIVASAFHHHNRQAMFITSVCEGKHSEKSKHYIGYAFDIRTPVTLEPSGEVVQSNILEYCCDALGSDWDCIDEGDHWHFEYDPKGQPV